MRVSIIGVGLMGGSLGMALRKRLKAFVKGHVRREETGMKAVELGALDEWSLSLEESVKNADYVFFATPVKSIINIFKEAQPFLKKGTLVSDLGSTKRSIVREITPVLRDDLAFIGGHPMTGSEKSGIEHARADLYEGATYILTPVPPYDRGRIDELIEIIKSLGANPFIIDPEKHDLLVALVSHLPYLISVSLVKLLDEDPEAEKVVAGNFRDLTRPASSDPTMWKDILRDNRDFIKGKLFKLYEIMVKVLEMKEEDLYQFLSSIKNRRDSIFLTRLS